VGEWVSAGGLLDLVGWVLGFLLLGLPCSGVLHGVWSFALSDFLRPFAHGVWGAFLFQSMVVTEASHGFQSRMWEKQSIAIILAI